MAPRNTNGYTATSASNIPSNLNKISSAPSTPFGTSSNGQNGHAAVSQPRSTINAIDSNTSTKPGSQDGTWSSIATDGKGRKSTTKAEAYEPSYQLQVWELETDFDKMTFAERLEIYKV